MKNFLKLLLLYSSPTWVSFGVLLVRVVLDSFPPDDLSGDWDYRWVKLGLWLLPSWFLGQILMLFAFFSRSRDERARRSQEGQAGERGKE